MLNRVGESVANIFFLLEIKNRREAHVWNATTIEADDCRFYLLGFLKQSVLFLTLYPYCFLINESSRDTKNIHDISLNNNYRMQNMEENTKKSFFAKARNPYLTAAVCLVGSLLFMIFGNLMNSAGLTSLSERFPYISVGSFMLLFAVYNSVFSLSADDLNQYWVKSFIAYSGLVIGGTLIAYLFTSLWLPGTFRWIFSILTFAYLAFLSIMGFVKRMFLIVKREDERMHGKWDE